MREAEREAPLSGSAIRKGCNPLCPACKHRDLSAEESERKKHDFVSAKLGRFAEVDAVRGPREDEARWGYRNKACLHARYSLDRGGWEFGLLSGRGKEDPLFVPIPDCPVHSDLIRRTVRSLEKRLPPPDRFPLSFLVFSGTLVTFVLKQPYSAAGELIRESQSWMREWDPEASGVRGVFLNLNPSAGNRVFAPKAWVKVWGEDRIAGETQGLKSIYGPDSFQQLIPELYRSSLTQAADFLAPVPGDLVVDLCSGAGLSLQVWRKLGASAIGVELGGEAVRCADEALGEMGIVLRGRSSERLPQLDAWIREKTRYGRRLLLYANPPRLGLEAEVRSWIVDQSRPDRIAYLSCSPGTLAKDLEFFTRAGYQVLFLSPFDFFPQTHHVEVLALLNRVFS